MEVLDDEKLRLPCRGMGGQQRDQGVHRARPPPGRADAGQQRSLRVGQRHPEERGQQDGGVPVLQAQRGAAKLEVTQREEGIVDRGCLQPEKRRESLDHRVEGGRRHRLGASKPPRLGCYSFAGIRRPEKMLEQARLAHAGLADDREQAGAPPRLNLEPEPADLGQFGMATNIGCVYAQGIEASGRARAPHDAPQAHLPGQSVEAAGSLVLALEPPVDQAPGGVAHPQCVGLRLLGDACSHIGWVADRQHLPVTGRALRRDECAPCMGTDPDRW
jgi:hypothetical protein